MLMVNPSPVVKKSDKNVLKSIVVCPDAVGTLHALIS